MNWFQKRETLQMLKCLVSIHYITTTQITQHDKYSSGISYNIIIINSWLLDDKS